MADLIPRTTVIKNFLNEGSSRAVTNAEFMDFWKVCSEDERTQFDREARSLMPAPAVA